MDFCILKFVKLLIKFPPPKLSLVHLSPTVDRDRRPWIHKMRNHKFHYTRGGGCCTPKLQSERRFRVFLRIRPFQCSAYCDSAFSSFGILNIGLSDAGLFKFLPFRRLPEGEYWTQEAFYDCSRGGSRVAGTVGRGGTGFNPRELSVAAQ